MSTKHPIVGHVDVLRGITVEGWAIRLDKPAERIRIAVLDSQGTVVGTGMTGLQRPDVVAAGYPLSGHGFKIRLSAQPVGTTLLVVEEGSEHIIGEISNNRPIYWPSQSISDAFVRSNSNTGESRGRVTILACVDWTFRFQRPQYIALCLARFGYDVLYLQPHLIYSREPSVHYDIEYKPIPRLEIGRICTSDLGMIVNDLSVDGIAGVRNFIRESAFINRSVIIAQHPLWARVLKGVDYIADLMDDHRGLAGTLKDEIAALQSSFIEWAQEVVVTSNSLSDLVATHHKSSILIPNGCPEALTIKNMNSNKKKFLIYIGVIDTWFDFDLVQFIIDKLDSWHLTIVGDFANDDFKKRLEHERIDLVGEVDHFSLSQFWTRAVIGIIPFKKNSFVATIDPVKKYEYLMAGLPVVASGIAPNEPEDGIMFRVAESADEMVQFIRELSNSLTTEAQLVQQKIMGQHTWAKRALEFGVLIDTLLAGSRLPVVKDARMVDALKQVGQVSEFLGYFDAITQSHLVGWAYDPSADAHTAEVQLFVNDAPFATFSASEFRSDLKEKGIGGGFHGFSFPLQRLPREMVSNGCTLELRDARSGKLLIGSPKRLRVAEKTVEWRRPSRREFTADKEPFERAPNAYRTNLADLLSSIKAAQEAGRVVFVQAPLIDWNTPLFQRPQHMARALSEEGALVVYCTPLSMYDVLNGTWRLDRNLFLTDEYDRLMEQVSGVWVDFYSTGLHDARHMSNISASGNRVIYEYVDHIDPEISGDSAATLARTFSELSLNFVDLFVPTAKRLELELKKRFGSKSLLLNPNGTEISHFKRNDEERRRIAEMERIVGFGGSIVGYYGALAQWLDYRTIALVASQLPNEQFVFIGPRYDDKIKLPEVKNIHWLGTVPYSELPAYAHYFDVAVIPFKPGEIARTTSPLKLFEYFALGKPVVVQQQMEECVAYDFVRGADSVDSWIDQIRKALKDAKSGRLRSRLRSAAELNSWSVRARDLLKVIKGLDVRGRPTACVDNNVNVSLRSGNLNIARRVPNCEVTRNNSSVRLCLSSSGLTKGDYLEVEVSLARAAGPVCWKITASSIPNDLVAERKPVVFQIIRDEKVVVEAGIEEMANIPLHASIISGGNTLVLRIVARVDAFEDWSWGQASAVTLTQLEADASSDGLDQYVSSHYAFIDLENH